MLKWTRQLPPVSKDLTGYKPFIKNEWFRKNYMWFAYGLMIILLNAAFFAGAFSCGTLLIKILLFLIIYPVHELLHIITVVTKGNIYLTHSGLYFWLTPDAELSKGRYWLFMILPLLVLTVICGAASFFVPADIAGYLRYTAWINAVIAGSDIINSFLILIKPSGTYFYRGFYRHLNPEERYR